MKKIILMLLLLGFFTTNIKANTLNIEASAAYLIEYQSGKVLYAKNETKKLYPASMTKMMTLLLIFEALNDQTLTMNDQVVASKEACDMGGTQIYLKENEVLSVKDLLYSVILGSANDASVALAIHLKGSHENFVNAMNEKAQQLKLENSHFMNANGLHDDNHYSCAKDMAMIAKNLLDEGKQQLLKITSTYEYYIRQNSNPFWLVNTNKLLKTYPGVDGLKTGFTSQALSCITVTALKNNVRLISVVMHANDAKSRNADIVKLLDYGFSQMKSFLIYDPKQCEYTIQIENGQDKQLKIYNQDPIYEINDKKSKIINKKLKQIKKQATIQKGELIAYEVLQLDNKQVIHIPLYASKTIKKQSLIDLFVEQLLVLLFHY